jgi:hypothetical protein
MSEIKKDYKHTPEAKKNMSIAAKKREAKKKADGYVVPQSARDKQSKARKGKPGNKHYRATDATKAKLSKAGKDVPKSKKHRDSLSKANKNNPNCMGLNNASVITSRKNNPLYHHPYVDTMLELHEQGLSPMKIFRKMSSMYPELTINNDGSISSALRSIKKHGL